MFPRDPFQVKGQGTDLKSVDLLIVNGRKPAPMLRSAMRLSRERLHRILAVIQRQGGSETVRQLTRRFSISRHEVEEAKSLGFLDVEKRKPKTGRPSYVATLSKNQPAKLPPPRWMLERPIKFSHQKFAMLTVYASIKGGSSHSGFPGYIKAYQRTYPQAKSKNGAYASCSRLLRHPHVFAARQWYYARVNGEISRHWNLPRYESEIWEHLEVMRSWRAKFRPTRAVTFREQRW